MPLKKGKSQHEFLSLSGEGGKGAFARSMLSGGGPKSSEGGSCKSEELATIGFHPSWKIGGEGKKAIRRRARQGKKAEAIANIEGKDIWKKKKKEKRYDPLGLNLGKKSTQTRSSSERGKEREPTLDQRYVKREEKRGGREGGGAPEAYHWRERRIIDFVTKGGKGGRHSIWGREERDVRLGEREILSGENLEGPDKEKNGARGKDASKNKRKNATRQSWRKGGGGFPISTPLVPSYLQEKSMWGGRGLACFHNPDFGTGGGGRMRKYWGKKEGTGKKDKIPAYQVSWNPILTGERGD